MGRNRRNSRKRLKILEIIDTRTFMRILGILLVVCIISSIVIVYRFSEDKKLLAKQKQEMESRIQTIFKEAENNLEQVNTAQRDAIIDIGVVGDILCTNNMMNDALKDDGTYDFKHMYKEIEQYISNNDFNVGTMETNFYSGENYSGNKTYNSPKEFAEQLRENIDVVTLANNHIWDYGYNGLKETNEYLQGIGMETCGVTPNNETSYQIIETKGVKIAFLAYTYNFDLENEETKKYINIYEEERVKQDIEKAKEESEYICVLMHWGDISTNKVNSEQENIANFLISEGVDMILGSHPGVVQKMEIKQNKEGKNILVAYSLGNLLATFGNDNYNKEILLNVQLGKNADTGEVILTKVDYIPVYMLDQGKKEENRYCLVDMKKLATDYASGNKQATDRINRKTYNILVKQLENLDRIIKDNNEKK